MASKPEKHQVVIVGGGIAGLTLALMLQHLKIDYILLEAYGSITPNMGASIVLLANGLRILDQLGIYDTVRAKGQEINASIYRDGRSGKRIITRYINQFMAERHGYASIFMSRHQFLCILYQHIADKRRILVSKRVDSVLHCEDKVSVCTDDGSIYEGQMVVGADGVRSTVRREMWRNADATGPGAIPESDREKVNCEHACIFGTAAPVPDIDVGDVIGVCGRGTTVGCLNGRDELFLFWFWTLPGPQRCTSIDEIPRFTDEDIRRELQRGANSILADSGLPLAEVAKNLRLTGVTALPHFVLQRWHYGRIFILGDAAHKFNPLLGQGGNSCIESCAALVNALQEHLKPKSMPGSTWPLCDLTKVFTSVEEKRVPRLAEMVELCQHAIRGTAWESWGPELRMKLIVPLIPPHKFADFDSYMISGGLRLQGFNPPKATYQWPYEDDDVEEDPEPAPPPRFSVPSFLVKTGTAVVISVVALMVFFLQTLTSFI